MPAMAPARGHRAQHDQRSFLLLRAQPARAGLLDGSLSTLAPILAVAFATHQPRYAFLAGLATAIGAGISMAFSEGLSDTGDLTERGLGHPRRGDHRHSQRRAGGGPLTAWRRYSSATRNARSRDWPRLSLGSHVVS
jgi:hypothetical protein